MLNILEQFYIISKSNDYKYTVKITVKAPISMRIHTLYTNKQINFSFINNIWKNNKPKEFILPPDKDEGFYR